MKKSLAVITAIAAISIAGAAHAADASAEATSTMEQKSNGGYEATSSSEQKGNDGSKVTEQKKVDVDVDSDGKVSKTVKKEAVTSKGMMHKKSDTEENEYKDKSNGGYKKTKTHKHKNSDGTNVTAKTTTNVDVDKEGNVISTDKAEKTVDPKGLLNSTTTTTTTKAVNGNVIEGKDQVTLTTMEW